MQFFLDSALTSEIAYALDAFNIDGITTNPRHVQASGKPFLTTIREIARLVEGTDKTVQVEVKPHFTTYEQMLPEAEKLAAISPNFVIKLQCIEPAFKTIEALARKNIRANCTLVFSGMQGLQAMSACAYFISPFICWKEVNREYTRVFLADIMTIRDNYDFSSKIIVAAVRNARQVVDSALAGADIVTAALSVYQEGIQHPYTREGIARFSQFWDATPYE